MATSEKELTLDNLKSTEGILTLGILTCKLLDKYRRAYLFVNKDDLIEVAKPGEIELDDFEEEDAISTLQARGYEKDELIVYLKGRDARKAD